MMQAEVVSLLSGGSSRDERERRILASVVVSFLWLGDQYPVVGIFFFFGRIWFLFLLPS